MVKFSSIIIVVHQISCLTSADVIISEVIFGYGRTIKTLNVVLLTVEDGKFNGG